MLPPAAGNLRRPGALMTKSRNLTLFGGLEAVNIRPLQDRVLIRRLDKESKSPGGIVIPDSAAEKPIMGEVVAAGSGKILDNGEIRKPAVQVGDRVLFGKYAGTEVKLDNQEFLVMREDDIMGIIEA
jgi:chaperonin GroES